MRGLRPPPMRIGRSPALWDAARPDDRPARAPRAMIDTGRTTLKLRAINEKLCELRSNRRLAHGVLTPYRETDADDKKRPEAPQHGRAP